MAIATIVDASKVLDRCTTQLITKIRVQSFGHSSQVKGRKGPLTRHCHEGGWGFQQGDGALSDTQDMFLLQEAFSVGQLLRGSGHSVTTSGAWRRGLDPLSRVSSLQDLKEQGIQEPRWATFYLHWIGCSKNWASSREEWMTNDGHVLHQSTCRQKSLHSDEALVHPQRKVHWSNAVASVMGQGFLTSSPKCRCSIRDEAMSVTAPLGSLRSPLGIYPIMQ